MRISGWSIESFGPLRDYSVRDLPEGLVVFHRPNEAGKTTLLAFLRAMLFGFPGAANGHAAQGGAAAGRIDLIANGAEVLIERRNASETSVRVRGPDGHEGDSVDLESLLSGVDDAAFRSVFAFGLGELQAFETLGGEALRERMFSASAAGAGRDARRAIERLTHGPSSLPAAAARIDALVESLNQLRPRRDAARSAALAYGEAAEAERRLAGEMAELGRRSVELHAARRRCELLAHLQEQWSELSAAEASLAAAAPAAPLPGDLPRRLRAADDRIAAMRGALAALEQEQAEAAQRRSQADPHRLGVPERCEELHRDLALQRARLERLALARARRDDLAQVLRDRLSALGPAWNVDSLLRCDAGAPARAGLRTLDLAWRDAAEEERRLSAAWSAASERRETLRRERADLADAMGDAAGDAARIGAQREALERLRRKLSEALAEQARGEDADRTVQERERAMRSTEGDVGAAPPAWLLPLFWTVTSVALAAMPWRAVDGDLPGAAAFALSGCAAALGAWGAGRLRHARAAEERRGAAEFRVRRAELLEARRLRDVHWRRSAVCLEAVAREAGCLGLSRVPGREDVEECQRALLHREADVLRRLALQLRTAETAEALEQSELAIAALEGQLERSRAAEAGWRRTWAEWKFERALPEDLALENAVALLDAIHEAQAVGRDFRMAEAEIDDLERASNAWEASARALLADRAGADLPVGEGAAGEALVARVLDWRRRDLEREVSYLADRKLESEIEERARRIVDAAESLDAAIAERSRRLAEAGVADQADLERRLELAIRRDALERAIGERRAALEKRIAAAADVLDLRAALSAGEPTAWAGRSAEIDAELRDFERRLGEAAVLYRDAGRRCRELEESSDVGRIELEWRGLTNEIAAAVRSWRVLALAQGLIEETLEEFRDDSRPRVLVEASRTFARVTAGRYARIEQDECGRDLVVREADGSRKRVPRELSRGTAEQLYLCLRLGLVADFARRGAELPLVMDDVLVNFDPERARAMAAALGDFARGRQILFFTCHPNICAMLAEAGNASAVIEG